MLTLVFLEFQYPVRFAVFSTVVGLLAPICNSCLFSNIHKKQGELVLNLIPLVVIVITKNHIDKIVLNLGSET